MNTALKNKKAAILLFCAVSVLLLFGCQTIEETIGQTDSDYGARRYHSEILRFSTIDPVAEKYPSISPYDYCTKGPIYIDLQGDSLTVVHDNVLTESEIRE